MSGFKNSGQEKHMKNWTQLSLITFILFAGSGCDLATRVEQRAYQINRYENVALTLSVKNRELEAEVARLKYEVQTLKAKNQFLQLQLDEKKPSARIPASVPSFNVKEDLVK